MAVPRYSIRIMYVVGEGYSNQAMNNLVKQAKTGVLINQRVRFALAVTRSILLFQVRPLEISTLRYLAQGIDCKTCPSNRPTWSFLTVFLEPVKCPWCNDQNLIEPVS